MDVKVGHFADIQVHAGSVQGWNQRYSQLSRGSLQSFLLQVRCDRFQLFRETINQRVVQHGEAPRGKICFALPLCLPGVARMQGREADERSLLMLHSGEEFLFHMPMGTDLLVVTIEHSVFELALAAAPQRHEIDSALRQPVLELPAAHLVEARRRLLALFDMACAVPDEPESGEIERQLENAFSATIVELLSDPRFDKRQTRAGSHSSFIVEKSHRLTLADVSHPLKVADICRKLRISRRSVQHSFRCVTETNPVDYIRCVRLNGVRRALLETSSSELAIGDAAAHWGFFHLSRFAADYRALFGELPSKTPRAYAARRSLSVLSSGHGGPPAPALELTSRPPL